MNGHLKNSAVKIKVCGMREQVNIYALAALKPDYMGLIFYPASKRFVDRTDSCLMENLSHEIKITGVFVDEDQAVVLQKVKQYGLNAIQLHGSESHEYCESLKKAVLVESAGIELIKAFGIDEGFDFKVLELYMDQVDYFLFDTKTSSYGGSGLRFNWTKLESYHLDKPYFLSGGIGLDDLSKVTTIKDHRLYAVDLNSRFEISPGVKNIEQVSRAIGMLRETF